MNARRVYSAKVGRTGGIIGDQTHRAERVFCRPRWPGALAPYPPQISRNPKDAGLLGQQHKLATLDHKSHWQVDLFFKWIKQHLRIKKF
jgi:hypothetical protein